MFRKPIRSVCNCRSHPFPVAMRYGGTRYWQGQVAHVMYCPVSGVQRLYVYLDAFRYVRAA